MKYRLLAAIFMFSAFVPGTFAATSFKDLPPTIPYGYAIYWTVNYGITKGYTADTWGPDNCVTRAEQLKMVLEYKYTPEKIAEMATGPQAKVFSDVLPTDWFTDYVKAGQAQNIVEGYSDGTFKPNLCVQRSEAMKMAVSTIVPEKVESGTSTLTYDDKTIADMDSTAWYAQYARPLFESRIVGTVHAQSAGDKMINFYADGDMSRKEVAQMLFRLAEEFPESFPDQMVTYTDPTLKLSFSYPKAWGTVTTGQVKGENGTDDSSYELSFSNRGLFLVANDPKVEGPGRETNWGGLAADIDSEEAVRDYCESDNADDFCMKLDSESDVYITRTHATAFGTQSEDNVYIFYNPNTNFSGVALSDQFIPAVNIESAYTTFKPLLDSIKLN